MVTNEQFQELVKGLNEQQLRELSGLAGRELRDRERRIDLAEITPEKMMDPDFAAAVRAEVERTLREGY
jgi:hypothetical protein